MQVNKDDRRKKTMHYNNLSIFEVLCKGKNYQILGERVKSVKGCWNCSFSNMAPEMIAECITAIFKQNQEVITIKFSFFKAQYYIERKFGDTFENVIKCIEKQKAVA